MAETFLFDLAIRVLGKLGSLALSEIGLAWGVEGELKKLETTLTSVKAVLLGAEEQQPSNHDVRDWLANLKDVVYDVEDVLDDFMTEDLRRKVVSGSVIKEVGNFFSGSRPLACRFKTGHKLKKIRERLDEIAAIRRDFHFTEQVVDNRVENKVRAHTHSFVRDLNVIGRYHDKEKIVSLLLGSSDHENVSVIPIVGLGGLGKTTLAKLVYNDARVVQNFELRMWVCVSQDFDLKKLAEKILKSANGANSAHLDFDQLQIQLRNHLNSNKYLLVLDDIWNDDPKKWMELIDLLIGGPKGSKIVGTTRSKKVASIMGTIPPYHLKGLPVDDCLSIFLKCAFKEGEEKRHPKLVEIGKAIVNKCGGVPLAVRTLGSLLYMKTEEWDWLYVKDNDIWKIEQRENDIIPILRLSYDQLPHSLKQCFAYCSIFPKGYQISREELIYLWIAQGFIQSPDNSQELEDIGNHYFIELLSRSFFQDVDETFGSEILSCKMHDLVHDLALSVAGMESSIVNFDTKFVSKRVRHVLFSEKSFSEKEFPRSLLSLHKVRSFSFSFKVGPIGKSFVDGLTKSLRCLRVLDFSESEFEELPNSIGALKHLRYLGLCENRSIKSLPNSICNLLNLQTFYLLGCAKLQELPRGIGKLRSLRHLYLTSQLTCLPEKGLEGLTSLRSLSIIGCNCLVSLSEGMQHLTNLRSLHITRCPRLAILPRSLKYLTALEKLWICDCRGLVRLEVEGIRSLRSLVISGLPNLVALSLQGPDKHNAATLQYLHIQDCPFLEKLPEGLKNHIFLLKLEIFDCQNLGSLPEGMHNLTALQVLCIKGCRGLSRRCKEKRSEIAHIPEIDLDEDEGFKDEGLWVREYDFNRDYVNEVAPWACEKIYNTRPRTRSSY